MARLEGFEPPTAWFVARYSIQLSYRRVSFEGVNYGEKPLSRQSDFQKLGAKNEKKRVGGGFAP